MRHHACGLSGLWTVRHPNLWGSMWYWDVNIQAAFAGVFSSNRLELAKVFSDGLLSYVDVAKKHAKNVHNAGGIAGDYPYSFYYSYWPWCAQYLWYLYEYSLDKEYLEKEAFPVFVGLCEFFADIFKFEGELHSEIEKIIITEDLVESWTYPEIQPKLIERWQHLKS